MPDVSSVLSELKDNNQKAIEGLKRDFSKVRAGKANPAILDNIRVEYYGQQSPLSQMSSVSTPDPRTILIAPWDKSALAEIEKAINKSNLGLTPQNDGKVVRINIPMLTEERRKELAKQTNKMAEETRIGIRQHRKTANEVIKSLEKDKELSEDDSRKHQEEVQKETDASIKTVDGVLEKKTSEIMTV